MGCGPPELLQDIHNQKKNKMARIWSMTPIRRLTVKSVRFGLCSGRTEVSVLVPEMGGSFATPGSSQAVHYCMLVCSQAPTWRSLMRRSVGEIV